jgi:hypothetical protein
MMATVNPEDVASIDAIVKALYESISFQPGKQPDYARLRSLFHPDGRLIPSKTERASPLVIMDIETFITKSREFVVTTGLERKGFSEREIARRMDTFGSVVHLFSTYDSRHRSNDAQTIQRGINSIQLVKDGNRWWVISILWDVERAGNAIPQKYLV